MKTVSALVAPLLASSLACGFDFGDFDVDGPQQDESEDTEGDAAAEGGSNGEEPADAQKGVSPQLSLLLTDAPAGVDAVFVTFGEVHVFACANSDEDAGEDPSGGTEGGASTSGGETEPDAGAETGGSESGGDEDVPETSEAPGNGNGNGKPDADEGEDEADEEDDADEGDEDGEGDADEGEDEADDEQPEADGQCEDGSWLVVSGESVTFDLLTLQGGVTAGLGLASLPEGQYGQIRMFITESSVVVEGQELPVTVPPGKLMLNGGFELEEGMLTEIVLDFDAEKSLHYAPGNGWMLKPVIKIVSETKAPIDPEDSGETGGAAETGGGEDTDAGSTTGASEPEGATGETGDVPEPA